MVKQKKKRNKQYKGNGAAQSQPTVTRVSAVKRNKAQLWWLERKRIVKPVAVGVGIAGVAGVLLFEVVKLVF
jgi:hypothetical protein